MLVKLNWVDVFGDRWQTSVVLCCYQAQTETTVTADYEGSDWEDENPSVFQMKILSDKYLKGEFQLTNGYGPDKAPQVMQVSTEIITWTPKLWANKQVEMTKNDHLCVCFVSESSEHLHHWGGFQIHVS